MSISVTTMGFINDFAPGIYIYGVASLGMLVEIDIIKPALRTNYGGSSSSLKNNLVKRLDGEDLTKKTLKISVTLNGKRYTKVVRVDSDIVITTKNIQVVEIDEKISIKFKKILNNKKW